MFLVVVECTLSFSMQVHPIEVEIKFLKSFIFISNHV